jgi:hypothetical protein
MRATSIPSAVWLSNRGLITCDERGVTFRWKEYRVHGRTRYKTMTLSTDEFIRRFLLPVVDPRNAAIGRSLLVAR